MLWARETEAGSFDTPERRAGLEARLNQVTAAIGNEAVRKYYRQDLDSAPAAILCTGSARRRGAMTAALDSAPPKAFGHGLRGNSQRREP